MILRDKVLLRLGFAILIIIDICTYLHDCTYNLVHDKLVADISGT